VDTNIAGWLVLVFVVEALILASVWVLLYQLLRQQGRILLRLDSLEQTSGRAAIASQDQGQLESAGLSVGSPAPPLVLPDLAGQTLLPVAVQGKRTLLIHWTRGCGFCDDIANDIVLLQEPIARENVQLVLICGGEAEDIRKLAQRVGLNCRVLLCEEPCDEPEIFKDIQTPAAYLLDDRGRVAQPLAVGSEQVLTLARAVAAGTERKRLPGVRALTASRIERNGLKAGTPAPTFRLPDLSGRPVALDDYRGRKVLLVFTDPHCKPCDNLAPHLARVHREHQGNGLQLVMVGRGDAEENRRKAKDHGLDFPVVLQKNWEVSKQYGIFATPVGFLISEQGVIEREVATGPQAILRLADLRRPVNTST
jgi:peroxiredoxin